MDISVFEAPASGDGDEPSVRDVVDLLDEDLQAPVKAAMAVGKHVGKLGVLLFAMGMCVVIYCFVLSWVCMFWLQTRLLSVATSLLHHCLDEPAASKHPWVDLHKPAAASKVHTSHIEAESRPPKPRSTWVSQPARRHHAIALGANSSEQCDFPLATSLEVIQHTRPSSSGSEKSQPSRRDDFVPQDEGDVESEDEGEDVLDRLLQREIEIEVETGARRPPQHENADKYTSAEGRSSQHFEEHTLQASVNDPFSAAHDLYDGAEQDPAHQPEGKSLQANVNDSFSAAHDLYDGAEQDPAHQPEGKSLQANVNDSFSAGHDLYDGAERYPAHELDGKSLQANVNDSFPAGSPLRNSAPSAVIDSNVDKDEKREQFNTTGNHSSSTTEQIVEAARFAATATKGVVKLRIRPNRTAPSQQDAAASPLLELSKDEQTGQAPGSWMTSVTDAHTRGVVKKENIAMSKPNANKPQVPTAARQKAAQVPLRQTTSSTIPEWTNMAPMLGRDEVALAQSPMASTTATPATKPIPPHVRKPHREAEAKRAAEEARASVNQKGRPSAAANTDTEALSTPSIVQHEREVQDDVHAVSGDLVTMSPNVVDKEVSTSHCSQCGAKGHFANICPLKSRPQAPVPLTCDNCGMNDHETSDCGICPDCGLYEDDEPCSRHAASSTVDDNEQEDHSTDLLSLLPPEESVSQLVQLKSAAAVPTDENASSVPLSQGEAMEVDLIDLNLSDEARSSSKSITTDHATESIARPSGSIPRSAFASHSRPAVDPVAAGPFQTDRWANKDAAIGLYPSVPRGMTPPSPRHSEVWGLEQPMPEPTQGRLIKRQGFPSLHSQQPEPEALADQAVRLIAAAPKRIMPPGLGGPQPGHQASFDALVAPSDVLKQKQKQRSGYDQDIEEAHRKMWQIAGLQNFSETFKVRKASASQVVDPSSSTSPAAETIAIFPAADIAATDADHGTSAVAATAAAAASATGEQEVVLGHVDSASSDAVQHVVEPLVDPEAKNLDKKVHAARETQAKQMVGGSKKAEGTDTGENSGSDDAKSAKQALREKKKATREALKVAWVEREIVRQMVLDRAQGGAWSYETSDKLDVTNISYLARRAELASLMADGKLHDDDAQVYPKFPDADTKPPEHKPEGWQQLFDRIKAEQAAADAQPPPPAVPEPPAPDAAMQELKKKLVGAVTLRRQAREYCDGPRKRNVSHDSWKALCEGKLKRADNHYRAVRKNLAAVFPHIGLPADLEAEFPEIQ